MRAVAALALAGCSLVDDYGRFHVGDGGDDLGLVADGAPLVDGGVTDDAGRAPGVDGAATAPDGDAVPFDLGGDDGPCGGYGEPCCTGGSCIIKPTALCCMTNRCGICGL